MSKRVQTMVTLVAAGALFAVPAVGQAAHKPSHTKGNSGGQPSICTKKPNVNKGFVVKGTVVSYTADDASTPANEGTVTITVTKANRHARVSGELATPDSNPLPGVQYTVPTTDAFKVKLSQYEAGETPGAGDKVRIVGKIAVERKRCAEAGDTTADRYGDVNVRRVRIVDAD